MKSRRILIVEDEMVVQLHLTRIVEELGHEVVGTAADREEAIELAAAERPELVLMDIHLASGSDGVETATQLVDKHGCAVVFISAYADQATVERTEHVGAAGYLVKPFTQAQVRAAIATAFASHARLVQERQRSTSLQAMLERIGGPVFLVDGEDRITFANQSAAELVGWPVYRTYGRSLGEILGLEALAGALAPALTSIRSGSDQSRATIELANKEGAPRVVDVAMERVTTDQDPAGGVLLTFRQRVAMPDEPARRATVLYHPPRRHHGIAAFARALPGRPGNVRQVAIICVGRVNPSPPARLAVGA
jgi:CheY-like chemotaxis protein